ncbi:hypothetical protein K2Y11_19650 [bacterium]|nr:hypothetical protein [bacterium]
MYERYFINIGKWKDGNVGEQMNVYSKVQLDDEAGDDKDNWICDSFTEKIGSGRGFWVRRVSSREILLFDQGMTVIEARIFYEKWPFSKFDYGKVKLRKAIWGEKELAFWANKQQPFGSNDY